MLTQACHFKKLMHPMAGYFQALLAFTAALYISSEIKRGFLVNAD